MEPATMMGIGALMGGASSLGSLFGGESKSGLRAQEHMHVQNLKAQERFAQEGIRWRVADAKAAGIHPLYALGASIPSYSPSTFIPGDSGRSRDYGGALRGLGDAASGLARSMEAGRTARESMEAKLTDLALKRAELENDLLSSQIALVQQQAQPRMPEIGRQFIPGQADVERLGIKMTPSNVHAVEKPQEVTPSFPGKPWQDPAAISDIGFVQTSDGGFAPVPSKDAKERMEDMLIPEVMWALRNHLVPTIGDGAATPPDEWLPTGAYSWRYDAARQAWYPHFRTPKEKPSFVDQAWRDAARRGEGWSSWSGRPYLGQSRRGSYW